MKKSKFDCVHRYKRILPFTPLKGMRVSDTEDECLVMGKIIPCTKGCNIKCKGYVSRYKNLREAKSD